MFKKYFRKTEYVLMILSLIKEISNWPEIFLLFIRSKETIISLKNGASFKISHYLDLLTIKEVFLKNAYNLNLKKPKVILDIGANIGTYSICVSKRFPNAVIYAYEPAKVTFRMFKENLKLNDASNVHAYRLGVAGGAGLRDFYTYPASGLSSLMNKRENSKKEKIKVTTLSQIFKENSVKTCDLIKMDCEGAEYEILFGAPKSIYERTKAFAIEYHDEISDHSREELINFLKSKGYKLRVKKHPLEENIGLIYAKR